LGYHSGRRLARLLLLLANFGTEGSPQPSQNWVEAGWLITAPSSPIFGD
jgi:hypothetical protein